jgi:autotransporter-associated beta strand protein
MPAAFAQNATWLANPGSGNFSNGANWTPATVPTGFATFGNSSTTTLTFSGSRNLDGFVFDAGAPAYTFNLTSGFGVVFHTDGIVNNSANAPTFNVSSSPLRFDDTSSAGNAIINLNAGTIQFLGNSTAGLAQLNAAAGTTFDFTGTVGPASNGIFSAGSISGAGRFDLGAGHRLVVGGNNLSTNLTGSIVSGSIEKVGTGTLILAGANTYTGGTVISAGTLQANNNNSVGSGVVTLDGGTFRSGAANLSFANDFVINATGGTIDNGNRRLTLSGVISDGLDDPAQLRLIGGGNGTTILSGVNTYSAGTLVSRTTVQVRNDSAVGAGTVILDQAQFQAGAANLNISNSFVINDTPAGSAIDNNNRVLTLSGSIMDGNGPGMLTFGNSGAGGRTILTGTNTYTGGTDICNCATVQLGDASHTASIVGRVRNDGEFRIVNADTSGITRIVNNGFTGFFNTTSAGTATIVNSALLEFSEHSTAGNATIRNLGGYHFPTTARPAPRRSGTSAA